MKKFIVFLLFFSEVKVHSYIVNLGKISLVVMFLGPGLRMSIYFLVFETFNFP